MTEGAIPSASPSDAKYAQALGLEPAALQAREETPSTAEAEAVEGLGPYLAASPTVPGVFRGAQRPFQAAWQRLSLHAVTVARCTSELAGQGLCPTPGVEQTFLAGLLHDVGLAGTLRAVSELVSCR